MNYTDYQTDNLFGLFVAQDLQDPDRNVAYLLQGGLGMPDREYYLAGDAEMASTRQAYEEYVNHLLEQAKLADAPAKAKAIVALETRIAKAHSRLVDTTDVHKVGAAWATSDFAKQAPGLDWATYFEAVPAEHHQRGGPGEIQDRDEPLLRVGDPAERELGRHDRRQPERHGGDPRHLDARRRPREHQRDERGHAQREGQPLAPEQRQRLVMPRLQERQREHETDAGQAQAHGSGCRLSHGDRLHPSHSAIRRPQLFGHQVFQFLQPEARQGAAVDEILRGLGDVQGAGVRGVNLAADPLEVEPDALERRPDPVRIDAVVHGPAVLGREHGRQGLPELGNGSIEVNNNATSDNQTSFLCQGCHTAAQYAFADTSWPIANVVGGGMPCGFCHTAGVTPTSASGAHVVPRASQADLLDNGASCFDCHGNNAELLFHNAPAGSHGIGNAVNFANVTYSQAAVRNNVTGTCLTANCHNASTGTLQSTAWNSGALDCDDCHYYAASPTGSGNTGNPSPLSTSHKDHFNNQKVCDMCQG